MSKSFEPNTKSDIYRRLVDNLEAQFDAASVEVGDYTKKLLAAYAETLAENQEQALLEVYESSYLATADGNELDKLVELIGLQRKEAVQATGVVTFTSDTPVTTNRVVQKGSLVETFGEDPVTFETTEVAILPYVTGFESNSLNDWSGDVSAFNVVKQSFAIGDYICEVPATDGAQIRHSSFGHGRGITFDLDVYLGSNTAVAYLFAVQDSSNYYAIVVDDTAGEIRFERVENGTATTLDTTTLTVPTGQLCHLTVDWQVTDEIAGTLYKSRDKNTEIAGVGSTDSTFNGGTVGIESRDANGLKYVDEITSSSDTANVRCTTGGVEGNVGDHTLTVMPSWPAGIDDVTNPLPTGDSTYTDTNGEAFVTGQDRETDAELRERARDTTSLGGAATAPSIETALQKLDEVQSVTMFVNRTDTDNTGSGGLPPHSFEAVVYGGTDKDVGTTIYENMGVTAHDYGGAHGTKVSYTVTDTVLDKSITVNWSRPTKQTLDITLDIAHDDTYVGNEAIKSRVVEYIGGTDVDGSEIPGLDVGEDVYVSVLADKIVGPSDTGVFDVEITIDKDGDGTSDITTSSSGAEIISVNSSSVARTNGRDGSIQITTEKI